MTDNNRPHLMDVLEKFVTTATRAAAYAVVGVFGARYHYGFRDQHDPFVNVFGWIGLGTIFAIAAALNFWAFFRAERDLEEWAGRNRWRRFGGHLILAGLMAATAALAFQVPALLQPVDGP